MNRRTFTALAALAGFASIRGAQAQASGYPNRPIRIVVPFATAGIADTFSRAIGAKLSEAWGQTVVIENKPGAETLIALNHIAQATPDGHTLLVTSAPFAIGPLILRAFKFDQINDLTHIGTLVDSPAYLYTSSKMPFSNLAELAANIL